MISQTSLYDNPHSLDCTCPNCGHVHAYYDQTRTTMTIAYGMIPPAGPDPVLAFNVVFESERYENERRSRALGRLYDTVCPTPALRARPRRIEPMVHRQRCPDRRPRRSLRERVRLAW